MKGPSLSVIIPAFNEEHSLGYILSDTLKNLPKIVSDFELIIIDDGSTDKTVEIAKSFERKSKKVKVVHQKHLGFGSAILTGIKLARKEYVVHMQANGQDLVRDMVNSFKVMDKYDLVLGVRGTRIDYDLYRLLLSYGGLYIYKLLFGISYEDVHWTYIWKTREIKKLKLDPNGGIFLLVESLIRFKAKGLSIGEATSPYRPRFAGVSKNTNFGVLLKSLMSMIKFWWKFVRGKI